MTQNTKLRIAGGGAAILVLLLFAGLAIGPPVQECVDSRRAAGAYRPEPERPHLTSNLSYCGWAFLTENTEAILALATIGLTFGTALLAYFTYRLWGVTNATLEQVRKDFLTTQRPHLIVRAVSLKSVSRPTGPNASTLGRDIEYHVVNVGGSEATIVYSSTVNRFLDKPEAWTETSTLYQSNLTGNRTLASGEVWVATVNADTVYRGIGKGSFIGRNGHYYMGYIEYIDALEIKRRTSFLRLFTSQTDTFVKENDNPDYDYSD